MKKAFTFIEILVVIAIIGVFSVSFLAFYNNYAQDGKLNQELTKLNEAMFIVQRRALSPGNCLNAGNENEGYQIEIVSPTTYNLEQCCGTGAGLNFCSEKNTVASYTISFPNITISSYAPPPAVQTILFQPRGIGTVVTPSSANPLILKNSLTGRCGSVTVSTSGTINMSSLYNC